LSPQQAGPLYDLGGGGSGRQSSADLASPCKGPAGDGFPAAPLQYSYLRNPGLVWTHVVSDLLIGSAYLAISVTLGYLVHKARRDIRIFLAFGLFIIACGGTSARRAKKRLQ